MTHPIAGAHDAPVAPGAVLGALRELAETASRTADTIAADIARAATMVRDTVRRGVTRFFCGNGGSAADAQHIATEYVVRDRRTRRAYPAVALTTDTSLLTAAGNDFGFEAVFARQVEALCRPGDSVIVPTDRTDRAQEMHLCIQHAICDMVEAEL